MHKTFFNRIHFCKVIKEYNLPQARYTDLYVFGLKQKIYKLYKLLHKICI